MREGKRKIWDNRQKIVKKICLKCKKEFETKLQCGYMYCKECNNK